MDKRKMILILAVTALVILVASVPATYIWGAQVGAILRWCGVAVGVVYFILRTRFLKNQK